MSLRNHIIFILVFERFERFERFKKLLFLH